LARRIFFLTTESHKEAPKELFSLSDNPRKIYRKIKSKSKKSLFWVEKKKCAANTQFVVDIIFAHPNQVAAKKVM